jgi:O-antigen/teichoic acid export membrane protein
MARGALWMLLLTGLDRSLGVISTLILVRLLSPSDFGIVAMAMSFVAMAQLLTAFGFDVALIQRRDATEAHYHSAWTLNAILGLLIMLVMITAAEPISRFYGQPAVFWVVCAIAMAPLIGGFENIGVVTFRRELSFRREFTFQLSRKVIGFAVTIPLAFWLRNYWALVVGMITLRLAGTVTSYIVHPFRPRPSLAKAPSLIGFSRWLLLNNIVGFLKERSSDFFIGRMLGPAPLGVYNVTYEIASMPTTEVSAPINRALLPGFSRIASDAGAMRIAYGNALGMLALFAVPAAAGIFAVAPFIVPVLLGPSWLSGVFLMEILAFNGGLLLFHSSICTVLIANGHPQLVTKTNGLYVIVLLILFAILIPTQGLPGAAFAALTASVLLTPVYLAQVRRSLAIPTAVYIRVAARPLLAAVGMALLVRLVLPDWTPGMPSAVAAGWLLLGIGLGILSYALLLLGAWRAAGRPEGAEQVLLDKVMQRIHRHAA